MSNYISIYEEVREEGDAPGLPICYFAFFNEILLLHVH